MALPFAYEPFAAAQRSRAVWQRTVGDLQAAKLTDLLTDVGARRRVIDILARRRSQGGGQQFELLEAPDRREVLAAHGDVLALAGVMTDDARTAAERAGFEVTPVVELRQRVVRLHREGATTAELQALRREIGTDGTSLSSMMPCRMVIKSIAGGTPEEATQAPPQRRDVPVGSVGVAVLDTGINVRERSDGWLAGLQTDDNTDPLNVLPRDDPDDYLDFAAGHGTFVAGIVQQLAPAADLRISRVLDSDGMATELEMAVAIVQAVERNLDPGGRLVLNLSTGTETDDDRPPVGLQSALDVVDALQAERGGEVLVVAAAGNEGRPGRVWPAAFGSVVAVGALDQDDSPAAWSSRGSWVTCSTIGQGVLSTFVEGKESRDFDPEPEEFGPTSWAVWTGTSFTAPQVAGAVAGLAERKGRSLRWALHRLLADAPRYPGYGRLLKLLP